MTQALIFGAKGSIGNHIFNKFNQTSINVIGTTSTECNICENIIYVKYDDLNNLSKITPVDIIIWASGNNCNDNILNYNNFNKIFEANVLFIMETLHYLLVNNKINHGAKLVIISSIWEEFTRENKLSYSISKSALSGLVKNVAFDLSKHNILINNVLPGIIDNEMTRKNLSDEQINKIKQSMQFNRLINLEDVYNTINFLVTQNTGITGQSIKIDLGFTNLKQI